jgi:hypothetical protein
VVGGQEPRDSLPVHEVDADSMEEHIEGGGLFRPRFRRGSCRGRRLRRRARCPCCRTLEWASVRGCSPTARPPAVVRRAGDMRMPSRWRCLRPWGGLLNGLGIALWDACASDLQTAGGTLSTDVAASAFPN